MLRGVGAATIGTTIEWYDFLLYGLAAPLVFSRLFFSNQSPATGVLLAFSTFAVGFLTRPVGAVLFGHFGDRVGRKSTLTVTLILTGASTLAIGLLPTFDRIGTWAPLLLVMLRMLQGIGVGGEWGGSVLVAMEWEQVTRWRGFFTSWPQWGVPAGMLLASGALAITTHVMSPQNFTAWGWRIPFLLSAILVGFGLYLRLGLSETAEFTALRARAAMVESPVTDVLRDHWPEVALTSAIRAAEQAPYFVYTTFLLYYGTQGLGLSRAMLLDWLTLANLVSMVDMPFWGYLSDRIGRGRLFGAGAAALILFAFPYFALLRSRLPALVGLAIILSIVNNDVMYGPEAALIAESFPTQVRYTGASLGYQLSSICFGGPAPMIAVFLIDRFHSTTLISAYLVLLGVISLTALYLLRRRTGPRAFSTATTYGTVGA